MNDKFSFFISDKEPFIVIEKSVVHQKDECLEIKNKEKTYLLPANQIHMLILNHGTSITQPACLLCAKYGVHIVFAKRGLNIQTVWNSPRYQNPTFLINQFQKNQDKNLRLSIAKEFIIKKIERDNQSSLLIDKIKTANTINYITGLEAFCAKQLYKNSFANFKRDFKSKDEVNKYMNIGNNLLYNFITSIIIGCNLSPSLGFVHGQTRRGSLTFDIADLYKSELIISTIKEHNFKTDTEFFSIICQKIRKNNKRIVKEIINICKYIGGKEKEIFWCY